MAVKDLEGLDEASELLGITPQAVDKRRRAGKLLALPVGRAYLYPAWQFDERGRGGVVSGLEEVLGSLGVEDAWMKASFFLRQNGRLDDKRPLNALRNGEIEAVERAARLQGARRGVTQGLGPPPPGALGVRLAASKGRAGED